ncbi:Clock-controlled protein [Lachnellula suecica]|uniref:Clock-controlled protein n=1 Tax=Lachnellula suecica TaxID=602035 RepID=A0A8T9BQG8_9HELO|nr:Clock-controlled protein [Lachnellula suecica]
MQYSAAAVLALAASSASAWATNGTVVYTTEVFTAYTTFCPASTEVTFNGVTYTATAVSSLQPGRSEIGGRNAWDLSFHALPITINSAPTTAPVAPVYPTTNGTAVVVPTTAVGTTSAKTSATASATPSTISSSSGNKAFAFSGASLAGLLGLAAYVL